jgi:hypothetical protein
MATSKDSLQTISPLKEFSYRRQVALKGGFNDITARLLGFVDWMESVPLLARGLRQLRRDPKGKQLVDAVWTKRHTYYGYRDKPGIKARSIDEIVGVGLALLDLARAEGQHLYSIGVECGIYPDRRSTDEAYSEAVVSRFIVPFLDYLEQQLPVIDKSGRAKAEGYTTPAIIHDSLRRFRATHRKLGAQCFVMMRFGDTVAHTRIERTIKNTLKKHGLVGLLARDREFHEDLYSNILTYAHGCDFGIAVFERLKTDEFNPNVALEVGYMFGLKKQVLLLKDQTLRALHTDLVGKLYKEFDPQHPERTIPGQIDRWLTDKGLA